MSAPTIVSLDQLALGGVAPTHGRRDVDQSPIYDLWMIGSIPKIAAAGYVHIAPRKRTAPHAHSVSEHFSCVVRGRALLWVESSMIELGPGDCYTVPANQIHELAAAATEDCWVFEGTAPLLETAEEMAADFVNARRSDIEAQRTDIDAAFEAAYARQLSTT